MAVALAVDPSAGIAAGGIVGPIVALLVPTPDEKTEAEVAAL